MIGVYNNLIYKSDSLFFLERYSKYWICGNNGSGKSTMCNSILYPRIVAAQRNLNPILYITQNSLELHHLTKTYYNYFQGKNIQNIDESIIQLIFNHVHMLQPKQELYMILDEVENYLSIQNVLSLLLKRNITLFFVSHGGVDPNFNYKIILNKMNDETTINITSLNN